MSGCRCTGPRPVRHPAGVAEHAAVLGSGSPGDRQESLALSMLVAVVQVGNVRVGVDERLVRVTVCVARGRGEIRVLMVMMGVDVGVLVVMFDRLMTVVVGVIRPEHA